MGFFPRHRAFGFGGCPYWWFGNNFRFGDNLNCFNDGFFFDPFFLGWFPGPLYGPAWFEGATGPDSTVESPAEANPAYPPTNSGVTNERSNSGNNTPPSANGLKVERPVTLLQLRDGSMYGLTDYWVEGSELHYMTTYGGQGSVPFERIDFEKTVQLNADRGVQFVLRPQ